MKRVLFIFLLLVLAAPTFGQEKLSIVTSASMLADMAKNVTGDLHDVKMIVPIGGDPHLHEPTPSNAKMVADADIIFINGLTFEGWINELIENSGTKAQVYIVTDGVDVLSSQTYQNSADPHAWMNVANGKIYTRNIAAALKDLDPKNAGTFEANAQAYMKALEELDKEIEEDISKIPEAQRILITSHDAFQYYGRRYNIRLEAIMGISTEAEAQTSDIQRVNKVIQEGGVPAIFIESTINPKLIKQLAADNKISIGGELYADSLGDKDSPASTYIDMLRYNTKTIVKGLTQKKGEISNTDGHNHGSSSGTNVPFLIGLGLFLFLGLGVAVYLLNR